MRVDGIQPDGPVVTKVSCIDTANSTTPRIVNAYRLMSSIHLSNRCKSDAWNELKKDFAEIGVPDRTIDSLALIPLVETALDDDCITKDEKEKILAVMKRNGLLILGIDPNLNNLWAPFKGRTAFLIVWTVYLRDLSRQMLPQEKSALKALVIESWKFMIRTIGGFLKIRDLDDRIMIAIESAFAYEILPFHKRQGCLSIAGAGLGNG